MERLLSVLIGYALGLIQTGYIYGKLNHIDIRTQGSGNAGTTNALRTLGWKAGVITFIGDLLKSVAAIVLVRIIFAENPIKDLLAIYAGLGAVLGHNFPFYLKFKGGKGIASTVGMILALDPLLFAVVAVVFVIVFILTKYVSLGSIIIMIVFVIEVVIWGENGGIHLNRNGLYEFYAIAAILAVLAIIRHKKNIKRLLSGTENKIYLSKIGKK